MFLYFAELFTIKFTSTIYSTNLIFLEVLTVLTVLEPLATLDVDVPFVFGTSTCCDCNLSKQYSLYSFSNDFFLLKQ